MSVMKFILPVLAGAQMAVAQCSVAATSTISNAVQATTLASNCRTFTGNIAISPRLGDNVAFDGLEQIKNGGIYAANGAITGLSSTTLNAIDGQFYLQNNTALNSLSFPSLTQVNNIHWVSLASLYGWTLTQGIQSAARVTLSDIQIASLDGLNLKTVDDLTINNNILLQNITMQLQNITGIVSISQNGKMPTVSFPELTTAVGIDYRGVSSVDLSSLKVVNQSMGIIASSLQTLSLPKLTQVGDLSIIDSKDLKNISAPKLELIDGSLTISNAVGLSGTIAFPQVTQVRGAVRVGGDFSNLSMPKVTFVKGAFNIKSTKNIQKVCDYFTSLGKSVIQGKYSCVGKVATPTVGAVSGTPVSGGGATSTGAAPRMQHGSTPMIGGVLGVFLAILGML